MSWRGGAALACVACGACGGVSAGGASAPEAAAESAPETGAPSVIDGLAQALPAGWTLEARQTEPSVWTVR